MLQVFFVSHRGKMPRNSIGSLRHRFLQLKANQPEELMPYMKAGLSAHTADGWASQGVVVGVSRGTGASDAITGGSKE